MRLITDLSCQSTCVNFLFSGCIRLTLSQSLLLVFSWLIVALEKLQKLQKIQKILVKENLCCTLCTLVQGPRERPSFFDLNQANFCWTRLILVHTIVLSRAECRSSRTRRPSSRFLPTPNTASTIIRFACFGLELASSWPIPRIPLAIGLVEPIRVW